MNLDVLYVVICYVIWGLQPFFWKLLSSVNSVYVLTCRIFWSFILCGLILVVTRGFGPVKDLLKKRGMPLRFFLCGLTVSLNWGTYIIAVHTGHIIDSSLAFYLVPLLSLAFGALFFKERLTLIQWSSFGIAAIGVGVSVAAYGDIPWFALLMAITFATYSAMKKAIPATSVVSTFTETLTVLPIAVVYMLYAEFTNTGATGVLSGWQYLLLPCTGLVTGIPLLMFARGVKRIPITLSGILMYINPTIQLLIGVYVYGEPFPLSSKITFICVWIGLIVFLATNIRAARMSKSSESE